MAIELPRRRFLAGITAVICAPAIVRAASLMPVKVIEPRRVELITTVLPIASHASSLTEARFREIVRRALANGMKPQALNCPNSYVLLVDGRFPLNSFQGNFHQVIGLR